MVSIPVSRQELPCEAGSKFYAMGAGRAGVDNYPIAFSGLWERSGTAVEPGARDGFLTPPVSRARKLDQFTQSASLDSFPTPSSGRLYQIETRSSGGRYILSPALTSNAP